MKLDITLKGVESCGPDPEEEFRAKLLALLERIALALETGPHVPHEVRFRIGEPQKET